jgi:hypothetical protein
VQLDVRLEDGIRELEDVSREHLDELGLKRVRLAPRIVLVGQKRRKSR